MEGGSERRMRGLRNEGRDEQRTSSVRELNFTVRLSLMCDRCVAWLQGQKKPSNFLLQTTK